MNILHCLVLFGFIAAVTCYRCHVTDTSAVVHCGEAKNMTCSTLEYTPYCSKIEGDTSQMNGVCTCEKYCFSDSDCTAGCPTAQYKSVCSAAYTGATELVCLCKLTGQPVG